MANFTLTAESPLAGFSFEGEGITLHEVTGQSIVSIATPHKGESALAKAILLSYQVALPEMGQSINIAPDNAALLRLQPNQLFLISDELANDPISQIKPPVQEAAYLTDQSDAWVMIRVVGIKARTVLERICPINLQPDVFKPGFITRTMMEHMGVIIWREDENSYVLMGIRSSAHALLHAVEVSVSHVITRYYEKISNPHTINC